MTDSPFDNVRNDGPLRNIYTGMGVPSRDPSMATTLNPEFQFLSRQELGGYHRLFWQCRKIVDIMPTRMTRRWGTYSVVLDDGEEKDRAEMAMNKILWRYRHKFRDAQRLANLHGNAAIILVTDKGSLAEPINLRNTGRIVSARVVGRWSIVPDVEGTIWNFDETDGPQWFRPFAYIDQGRGRDGKDQFSIPDRIHGSHVLWFRGNEILDEQERYRNSGCDDSVIQIFYETLHRFQSTYDAGFRLLSSGTLNHQIEGLLDMLKQGGREAEEVLIDRAQLDDFTRSSYRQLLSDKSKESYQYLSASLGGASEIMELIKNELVAAASTAGIPPSLFYSEFSSGLDSAGKDHSERQTLNAAISDFQEQKFAENIEKLIRLIHATKDGPFKGSAPEDWRWNWTPLYDPTPQENAGLKQTYAMIDQANMGTGVYDAEVARRRYTGPAFQEDIVLTPGDLERMGKAASEGGAPVATAGGEALPEGVESLTPEELDSMSVEELEELESLLGGGSEPGVGTEEPSEEAPSDEEPGGMSAQELEELESLLGGGSEPETEETPEAKGDSRGFRFDAPKIRKKKPKCRPGRSKLCGYACIPDWKECGEGQSAVENYQRNLKLREETADDRYEQLRKIGKELGPDGTKIILDAVQGLDPRKWPKSMVQKVNFLKKTKDGIERKIKQGEADLDKARASGDEDRIQKAERKLELAKTRLDVLDLLGIDDIVQSPWAVSQDIKAFKDYLKANQGREEQSKAQVKTGLILRVPEVEVDPITKPDSVLEDLSKGDLSPRDQKALDRILLFEESKAKLERLREQVAESQELDDKTYNRIFNGINIEFSRIKSIVDDSRRLKADNPEIAARLAKIATVSKEYLPGYRIIPVDSLSELEKKAKERPC